MSTSSSSIQYQGYRAPVPRIQANAVQPTMSQKISNAVSSFFLFGVNKLFSYLVLPAMLTKVTPVQRQTVLQSFRASPVKFQTSDKASLDGAILRGNLKKAILYVGGNGERWETSYPKLQAFRQSVGNIFVFAFNPRGVGESKGTPNAPKMALDVHAAFRYLVDVEGIAPNDIIIFGHSLGGGYGAEGAALVQNDFPDQEIHYVSHNSFVDLRTEVLDIAEKILPRWLKFCLLPLVKRLLVPGRWQMNEMGAMQKLRGSKFVIVNKGDTVIPFNCSLYKGLKRFNPLNIFTPLNIPVLKMDPTYMPPLTEEEKKQLPPAGQIQHCRNFNPWERLEVTMRLRQMLRLPEVMVSLDPRSDVLSHQWANSPKSIRGHLKAMGAINRILGLIEFPAGMSRDERNARMQVAQCARTAILSKPLGKKTGPNDRITGHYNALKGKQNDAVSHLRHALNCTRAEIALELLIDPNSTPEINAVVLQQLGETPADPRDGFAENPTDFAELLFANIRLHAGLYPAEIGESRRQEPQFARDVLALGNSEGLQPTIAKTIRSEAVGDLLNRLRALRHSSE